MDNRFPGEEPAAGHVSNQGKRCCRWTYVVRRELGRSVPKRCRLCGQDFARRATSGPARGAADQVRAGREPQDRKGTWAHDPRTVPSACRRGDRVAAALFTHVAARAQVSYWHEAPLAIRQSNVRSARILQTSTCSAMASASSTSIPRYRTVLSIFLWPSKSWTARRLPVRR